MCSCSHPPAWPANALTILPTPSFPHALQDVPAPVLPKDVTDAFDTAYANIRAFHEAQHSAPVEVETMPGVRCRRLTRPIGERGEYPRIAACCSDIFNPGIGRHPAGVANLVSFPQAPSVCTSPEVQPYCRPPL